MKGYIWGGALDDIFGVGCVFARMGFGILCEDTHCNETYAAYLEILVLLDSLTNKHYLLNKLRL